MPIAIAQLATSLECSHHSFALKLFDLLVIAANKAMLSLQLRDDCSAALNKAWDSWEALQAAHNSLASSLGQADARVNPPDGAEQGVEGSGPSSLPMRVGLLEEDLRNVHEHTGKLDRYINDMLNKMLGVQNQGRRLTDPLLSKPAHAAWRIQAL